jgi:hypothetical protein
MTASPIPDMLSADDVRELLRLECEAAGGQIKWAAKHGCTRAYVSSVIVGRDAPGQTITKALGLRKLVLWTLDNGDERA